VRLKSLRLRLGLAAAALIALALVLAGIGLALIFDAVLEARTVDDLDRTAKQIAGQVDLAPDGNPVVAREPTDPRYAAPYGGLYWQVEAGTKLLRSRSLWDKRLGGPVDTAASDDGSVLDLPGPDGASLIAVQRSVALGSREGERRLRIVVAEDRRDFAGSRATFLRLLIPSLAALFLILTAAMALFVHRALEPFRALQAALRAVHAGERARLPLHFPDEVQPLVADLNRLLDAQERALVRARASAADMAHGLKTPLAVLDALGRRIGGREPEMAAEIAEQARAMGGQVERALARARTVPPGDLRRRSCLVAPAIERLVVTMRRLPEGDSLVWEVSLPADLSYPSEEGELMEVAGNLLDNAHKWAHRRVRVGGHAGRDDASLLIEDDGPGMSEAAIAGLGRGVRWDENRPGTGFGLAIARDIADATGVELNFGRSTLGGLRAELTWTQSRMSGPKPASTGS
jgi:signal transduction histidine kinase